jgi:hypothetical protein
MPPIYRAPMRARDRDDVPPYAGARFGVANGVVGIGDTPGEKGGRMLARFVDLPDGGFVWTRTDDEDYFLGCITGAYRRDLSAPHGIEHVRPARWVAVDAAHVPAAVKATFARGGRNLQRTHDADAERVTAKLWAETTEAAPRRSG